MPLENFPVVGAAERTAAPAAGHSIIGTLVKYTTGLAPMERFPYLKPTPFAATWAAPQPIGIVPARVFGLQRRWLGFTFGDLQSAVTGHPEQIDVTQGSVIGNEQFNYVHSKLQHARNVTDASLRNALHVYETVGKLRTFGPKEKEKLAMQVIGAELTRRAYGPGYHTRPRYIPGGGVGVEVYYAPAPGEVLPYTAQASGPGLHLFSPRPAPRPVSTVSTAGGITRGLTTPGAVRGAVAPKKVRHVLRADVSIPTGGKKHPLRP